MAALHPLGGAQDSLLFSLECCCDFFGDHTKQCSEDHMGCLGGGIKPGLAMCKVHALPTMLSLRLAPVLLFCRWTRLGPPSSLRFCPGELVLGTLPTAAALSVLGLCLLEVSRSQTWCHSFPPANGDPLRGVQKHLLLYLWPRNIWECSRRIWVV